MFGILNIYKPQGITSHDVVSIVRKILGIKQVGHTGTLDPFAQGVLPVCIGKATRLIDYFEDDKEYLATIQFGASTDTYDTEGNILKKSNIKVTKPQIENALKNFQGEIEQIPPIYSAIKVNGKKLYEYARSGEHIEINPRKITVYQIKLVNFDCENQTAEISVKCSKGTYIRSIANDLGNTLGCFGYLTKLIRTQAGSFTLNKSIKLPIVLNNDELPNNTLKYSIIPNSKETLIKNIINPIDVISLTKLEVNDSDYEKISHGNMITNNELKLKSGDFLILVYNKNVIAIGQYEGGKIKVKKVFI